jgi:threonine dehydratase
MTSSIESMPDESTARLPTFADITAAAKRLHGLAVRTPLLESPALNERVGGRVLLKAETLQRTGSFKFRGAYNRISQIPEASRAAGVIAYSSGNHAQGVAAAAALLGLPATIIMPSDAPAMKLANTRAYGAEVIPYERNSGSREALAADIAQQSGATIVPPYDDPDVMAGQGTCGLEIAEQAVTLDARLDALLVCCGGGGLTAGCALSMAERSPGTAVHTVEPEDFDDTRRSLAGGERVANAEGGQSICDALLSPRPGRLTFAVNSRLAAGGLAVSDAEVVEAMAFAYRTLKLVIEPGGAVALAAVLAQRLDARGKTVAVVLSGGNVDPQAYAEILARQRGAL